MFKCDVIFLVKELTEIIRPKIICWLFPSSICLVKLWQYHWSNKQTIKCTCIILYNYTVHCNIRTREQSVRRQHRKRNSEKSEMVTYKHVTEVVRNRCVNHQAKRVDSRAIVLLIAISVGASIIWIIKQTNCEIYMHYTVHSHCTLYHKDQSSVN